MELNKDIADISAAEAEASKGRRFILCYHDFNIKNFARASVQIEKIANITGTPIAVAIVPSVGAAPEAEQELFRKAIDDCKNKGHELLLHGTRHFANLGKERTTFGKTALKVSGNEAEFAGLGKEDSQALLDRSIALWHNLGQEELPIGFVPTAWYDNNFLREQVLAQFKTCEDRTSIYKKHDLIVSIDEDVPSSDADSKEKESEPESIRSFGISFAGLPDITLGVAQTSACLTLQAPIGTPRLAIHDIDFQNIGENRILNLIRFALSKREQIFYRDL